MLQSQQHNVSFRVSVENNALMIPEFVPTSGARLTDWPTPIGLTQASGFLTLPINVIGPGGSGPERPFRQCVF
jgi:hypothetical protein